MGRRGEVLMLRNQIQQEQERKLIYRVPGTLNETLSHLIMIPVFHMREINSDEVTFTEWFEQKFMSLIT